MNQQRCKSFKISMVEDEEAIQARAALNFKLRWSSDPFSSYHQNPGAALAPDRHLARMHALQHCLNRGAQSLNTYYQGYNGWLAAADMSQRIQA